MIDRDLLETLIALALILACATTAIVTTRPPREERATRRKRKERRASAQDVPKASRPPAPAPVVADPAPVITLGGRARPRILTGEPAEPEPHRPAARRAVALVGGITALAAGGAVGLLVLVRALVSMFKRIGG